MKTEQVIEHYAKDHFMYTDVELQYFASTITKSLSTHKSVVKPQAPCEVQSATKEQHNQAKYLFKDNDDEKRAMNMSLQEIVD